MKAQLNKLSVSNILIFIVLIFLAIIVFANNGENYNFLYLGANYFMIVFVVLKLFYFNKEPFSLDIIFHFFLFFFFLLAPVLQFKSNTIFFSHKSVLDKTDFYIGASLTAVILCLYNLIRLIFNKRLQKTKTISIRGKVNNTNDYWFYAILLVCVLIYCYLNQFSIDALISQSYRKSLRGFDLSLYLLLTDFIRAIPVFLLLLYKFHFKYKKRVTEITLIIAILVCNFPTATNRLNVALVYLPLLVLYFKPLLKKKYFIGLLSFGLLFVFPVLHFFRAKKTSNYSDKILNFEMFNELHFDSFQHTMSVIKLQMVTYGEQLLGVLLFFVPRNMWENKPFASGRVLGDELDYEWKNIAISIFGEGYINFGYLGILLSIIILAVTNTYIDKFFDKSKQPIFKIILVFIVVLEFYFLRGGLFSSFYRLVVLALSGIATLIIFRLAKKKL